MPSLVHNQQIYMDLLSGLVSSGDREAWLQKQDNKTSMGNRD